MFNSLEEVRALVSRHHPKNLSEGYPLEMRRQVGAWLHHQHVQGATWAMLGPALGLSNTTARNWAKWADTHNPAPQVPTLVPIHITPAPVVTPHSTVPVLKTPNGYVVEGLNTQQLLALLRELG